MAQQKVEDSKVIEVYNTQGKKAAIEAIQTVYGVRDAYYVLRRIKANPAYIYDSVSDSFSKSMDPPFMELDELCVDSHSKERKKEIKKEILKPSKQTIEKPYDFYVQELIKERFMDYARFIQTDTYDRIWRINKTALRALGYQLELY